MSDNQFDPVRELENYLNSLHLAGVSAIPLSDEAREIVHSKTPAKSPQIHSQVAKRATSQQWETPGKQPAHAGSPAAVQIEPNKKFIFTVKGNGNPQSQIFLLHDTPANKNRKDDADFLLDKMIQGGMKMNKESVYLMEIVHSGTVDSSSGMGIISSENRAQLWKEIGKLEPLFIIAMGSVVTSLLFGEKVEVAKVRGQMRDCNGLLVMPTHHPLFVVNNYTKRVRGEVFEDLKQVLQEFNKC